MKQTEQKLTVFYDGGCPLCAREIGFYQRCRGADAIAWVDVSTAGGEVPPGLSTAALLARFHVMRADGTVASGGAGFAALWAALPGFRLMGRLFQLPVFAGLLEGAYRLFLPLRPYLQRLVPKRGPAGRPAERAGE